MENSDEYFLKEYGMTEKELMAQHGSCGCPTGHPGVPGVKGENFIPDSIVQTVSQRFIDRAKMGWNKYGTNLDRKDLSTTEWIQHFQDEIHDAYVYSEKLKQDEIKRNRLLDLSLKALNNYNVNISDREDGDLDSPEYMEYMELRKWYYEQRK